MMVGRTTESSENKEQKTTSSEKHWQFTTTEQLNHRKTKPKDYKLEKSTATEFVFGNLTKLALYENYKKNTVF